MAFTVKGRPLPLRLTVEASGQGYELSDECSGLRFSNVNPGGDEVCNFELPRRWHAANPEVKRLALVRVMSGLDVLWQGRIEEIAPSGGDHERVAVTAYGLGARLKDGLFQEVFVDRGGDSWREATLNRRLNLTSNNHALNEAYTAETTNQGLRFHGSTHRGIQQNSRAELMYAMPDELLAAAIQFQGTEGALTSVAAAALYATDDDSQAFGSWDSYSLNLDDTLRERDLDTPRTFLMLDLRADATHTKADTGNPAFRIFKRIAVYGDHGLEPQDNDDEPDGFLVSQMVTHVLAQVPDVDARRIDTTDFVSDHAAFADPVAHEDAISELDSLEGADWGTWGPESPLERSSAGQFDYTRRDEATQHWLAMRADFEDLDLESETRTLYNKVRVTFTDTNDVAKTVEREITVPELGNADRTAVLAADTLTTALAEQLGDAFLSLQGAFAPARGRGVLSGPITHYRRGPLPPVYLRADGSNIRIPDVLPTETLISLDQAPERRATFPIRRVEVDASDAAAPKVSVELDQDHDLLSVLRARIDLGARFTAPKRHKRRR